MIAWLLACLLLTIQLPDSSLAKNETVQRPEAPRFWVEIAEQQSGNEASQSRFIVQTSALRWYFT
jgi:hypothetical protein